MKFLVLFTTVLAVSSASFYGRKSVAFGDSDNYVTRGANGEWTPNDEFYNYNEFTQDFYGNKMSQGVENFFGTQGIYDKTVTSEVFRQILIKMFDRDVIVNYFTQQGIFEQIKYGQIPAEKIWDFILVHKGVFDRQVLLDLIKTPYLRAIFVQYGIFNVPTVDQFQQYFGHQDVYDYDLLEKLVDKTQLKYWLVKEHIFNQYWLEQTYGSQVYGDYFYNSAFYGPEYFTAIFSNVALRNTLIQYGIFNKYVFEQLQDTYTTQGFYSQVLLKQLINKKALWNVLLQYGVDQTTLKYLIFNEFAALNVFLKYKFSQTTPMFTYKQLVDSTSQTPELVVEAIQHYPYGGEFIGVDFKKTIFKPYKNSFYGFGPIFEAGRNEYFPKYFWNSFLPGYSKDKVNYLKNIIYGHQRTGLNQEYNQGYYASYPVKSVYPQGQFLDQQLL